MYKSTPKVVHGNGRFPQPDAAVHKIENDFIKNSSGILGVGNMSIAKTFPTRPAHGTLGDPVILWTNFFEVKPGPKLAYYRYSVTIVAIGNAPQASKTKTKRICELLLEDQKDLGGVYTDFRSNLYSIKKLDNIPRDITIPFRASGEDDTPVTPAAYRISIQDTGTVLIAQYEDHLRSSATDKLPFPQRDEALQTLNIVLGHHPQMRLDIATIGQNKHYPIQPSVSTNLKGGLHAIRGINKSVRPATGRLLLNVNVSHTVCHAPGLLTNLIDETGLLRDMPRLAKRIKLMRIQRAHLPDRTNKAGKRIPSVAVIWDVARTTDGRGEQNPPQVECDGAGPKRVKFYLMASQSPPATKGLSAKSPAKAVGSGSGQYISVWDYFSKHYPRIRMKEGYPVVNVGDKKRPIYLPVEACQVLAGQPVISKLDPNQTREMIQFACRRPHENAGSIVAVGGEVLGLKPPKNPALGSSELAIKPDLITVHARVLAPPQIKYLGAKSLNPSKGSWNMSEGIKFSKAARLTKAGYIVVGAPGKPGIAGADIQQAAARFHRTLKSLGLSDLGNLELFKSLDPPFMDNGKLQKCLTHIVSERKVQILLVILPYNDPTLYGLIKSFADRIMGLHTVCVVRQKFLSEKGQDQYFANVALKFNLKAGGSNHILDPAKLGIIKDGQTMVVGIDVTHPSPQSQGNAPSVAGVVASIDKTLAQWPSTTSVQRGRTEMVADLQLMFKSRLQLWQKHNKTLPANVLIYRDGVSEGQYQTVLDEELPSLRAACTSLYPANSAPALSLIIVGKRHHVRFYPTDAAKCDDKSNCRNGTVVDRGVTEVRAWEFYLQAHACLQGTARSAHYYVLLDEIFTRRARQTKSNAANALEELTHNLCHLFGRATKAVSVCPPAYYADLVCERSRHYLASYFDPAGAPPPAPSSESCSSGASAAGVAAAKKGKGAVGGGGGGGGGGSSGGQDDDDRPEPDSVMKERIIVHERLRDSMYYI